MTNDENYWRHNLNDGTQPPTVPVDPTAPIGYVPVAPVGAPAPAEPAANGGSAAPEAPAGFTATQAAEPAAPAAPAAPVAPAASATPEAPADASAPSEDAAAAAAPEVAQQADAGAKSAQQQAQQPAYAVPIYVQAQPPYGTAATPAPKSYKWIIPVAIIIAVLGFSLYAFNTCSTVLGKLYGVSSSSSLDSLTRDTVGVIYIDGTIQYDNTACSPEGLKELLDRAENNTHIKAVVLRVNSGGGVATAGEEMAEYVKQFSKPIVVSSASINASAAYEISSQADYIYVAKSTEIGAIGTAMELMDLSGLFDMLGISMETITSSDSKDSSYGYRELTVDEREYYQDMVDQINSVFVANVAEGRGMDVEDVQALATGMPFTGITSVENGLADEVGTREDAINKAAELAGITGSYDTVTIDFESYDLGSLYALLGSSSYDKDDLLSALGMDNTGAHLK